MKPPIFFVDTNVFVRYLTEDDITKAETVEKLLLKAKNRALKLVTSNLIIAELVWVLSSVYELENRTIADLVRAILNTEGLAVDDSNILEAALDVFEFNQIDFIDAYIIGYMRLKGIENLYSYDKKHLSHLPGIKRTEP